MSETDFFAIIKMTTAEQFIKQCVPDLPITRNQDGKTLLEILTNFIIEHLLRWKLPPLFIMGPILRGFKHQWMKNPDMGTSAVNATLYELKYDR